MSAVNRPIHINLCRYGAMFLSGMLALSISTTSFSQSDTSIREIEDSIIKIYTTSSAPDYFTPWRLLNPRQSTGSGTVIAGNLILTNAHVVANASYVQAQKHNDPKKYQAEVVFISHTADLALISVMEPGFFNNLRALSIGELPEPHQEVSVFGYPMGGKTLSITKGILSRVEQQIYAHSGAFLLAGQIDAAINPGNSGGPVIVDEKIIGVVMQANSGRRAENLGYFVPPSIIRHVLEDSLDGVNDGFPDLGFRTQNLDSPSAKSAYGLTDDQSGILVIKVFEGSPAAGILQENDVIMQIGEYAIADDSSIKLNKSLQTNFKHAIDMHHVNDEVEIIYSREGKVHTASLIGKKSLDSYSLVKSEQFDQIPEYYIYGGILFVPLNMNLIKRWGGDWGRTAPVTLLQARNRWTEPEKQELVVALQVLAADVNLGYHDWRNWVVEYFNDQPIKDFEHFSKMLKNNQNKYAVFENNNGYQMVINHEEALASADQILSRYRIPAGHSENLFK